MNNVVIACEIIRDEVEKAIEEANCTYPVVWIDENLHIFPARLKDQLQKEIHELKDKNVDNIIFAFGYCGNCFIGVQSSDANLVIPRKNDCIDMLLSDTVMNPSSLGCYFLTRGWLESEKAIGSEYDFYIKRYGEKRAKRIMDVMLSNYKSMMLIETGAYDTEKYEPQAKQLAEKLDLDFLSGKGSLRILEKLFRGEWDNEEFCIIPSYTEITLDHFGGTANITNSQGQRIE